jgi:manganese/zinc/iron transport system ATP- binding protein
VPGAPALQIHQLSVGYPGAERLALDALSLEVPEGARVALVGPNGAGKSTLLKAVAGLLPARGGTIRIYGQPVGACPQLVAYLPQRGEIDWRFPISVRKLVLTGRYVHLGWLRRPGRRDWALVDELLEQLGLQALADRQIGLLSGGQQQRALLARALAQEARLLLLDEPLNALDAETRLLLARVLEALSRQGTAFVVATHELGWLGTDFDRVLYLHEGRAVHLPSEARHALPAGQEVAWTG